MLYKGSCKPKSIHKQSYNSREATVSMSGGFYSLVFYFWCKWLKGGGWGGGNARGGHWSSPAHHCLVFSWKVIEPNQTAMWNVYITFWWKCKTVRTISLNINNQIQYIFIYCTNIYIHTPNILLESAPLLIHADVWFIQSWSGNTMLKIRQTQNKSFTSNTRMSQNESRWLWHDCWWQMSLTISSTADHLIIIIKPNHLKYFVKNK